MSGMNTIRLSDIQETQWGEEAVIQSPFDAKNYIKLLPWQEYSEEIDEYGSLREKARQRSDDPLTQAEGATLDAIEAYEEKHGFSDDFSTHSSWDQQAGAWTIDVDAFNEARQFWEFVGYNVEVDDGIDKSVLG